MTGGLSRVGDLELGQDLPFQRRSWLVQRVGWGIVLLLLLAAAAGLLGSGPLSEETARSADGALGVRYGRFVRHRAPTTLQLQLAPGVADQGQVRLWLDLQYLDGLTIENVFPEPERVEAGPGRAIYVFTLASPDQPATITFNLLHEGSGPTHLQLGLDGGPALDRRQFVYP